MKNTKLLAFDLDGTLSLSKLPMDDAMAQTLASILNKGIHIAVISGGNTPQLIKQVSDRLLEQNVNLDNLHLMPTCGTKYFKFLNNEIINIYSEDLSEEEKERIKKAFDYALQTLDLDVDTIYGEQIEDRGTQITFSALGQNSPLEIKTVWDPNQEKRKKIKELIDPILPDLEVTIGGLSSVDITKKGIDKEYGMRRLIDATGFDVDEIIFFGDKLQPSGNDYPVTKSGVKCIEVVDQNETLEILKKLLENNFDLEKSNL